MDTVTQLTYRSKTNRKNPWKYSFRSTLLTARIKLLQKRGVTRATCTNKKQRIKYSKLFIKCTHRITDIFDYCTLKICKSKGK